MSILIPEVYRLLAFVEAFRDVDPQTGKVVVAGQRTVDEAVRAHGPAVVRDAIDAGLLRMSERHDEDRIGITAEGLRVLRAAEGRP